MPNHRIMIVEDEALVALNLQKILESLGYEVPTVVYCRSAQLATDNRGDIVIDEYPF